MRTMPFTYELRPPNGVLEDNKTDLNPVDCAVYVFTGIEHCIAL